MVAFYYISFIFVVFFFFFFGQNWKNKSSCWELPLVGITPTLLFNVHRLHDKIVELLERSDSSTILNKCKYVFGYDMLITCDPANVHYVMNTQFLSYPKGIEWRKRFEIFEDSLLNFDFEEWNFHRSGVREYLNHRNFHQTSTKIIQDILTKELIPFLEMSCKHESLVDLKDMFHIFMSDFAYTLVTGFKFNSLDDGISKSPLLRAIDDSCETIFFRYLLPEIFWKIQKWLQIGKEKKMMDAKKTIHRVIDDWYSKKESELQSKGALDQSIGFNLLELYVTNDEIATKGRTLKYEVIKGNLMAMFFAVEDTTSITLTWFFWLLSQNPSVEHKLKEETSRVFSKFENQISEMIKEENLREMVYLHASLCETLRLFPPVSIEARMCSHADILPSGHHVNNNTIIFLSFYGMGRSSKVWGDDCHEFKPERWITEDGRIKYYPPHKFPAFSTGPRNCLGKFFACTSLKAIAAIILHKFDVKLMHKDRKISYNQSVALRMNGDMLATISRRSV